MTTRKRKLGNILKIIIITYCSIGIALFYLQEKFIFHPEKIDKNYTYIFDTRFKENNIAVNTEDTINVLTFFTDKIKKGVVLYFHGNRKNVEHYYPQVQHFTSRGYDVCMPDYPGFGKTTGIRTEDKLYQQAMLVYNFVASQYQVDSIVIFGKSLGTCMAAYVASQTTCKKLILETPYYSMTDLFKHYAPIYPVTRMITYKLPLYSFLADVNCKKIIIHGTKDEVIPYKQSYNLKEFFKPGDEFITIEGGKHNGLAASKEFQNMLNKELN